jgi:hypothetical protein
MMVENTRQYYEIGESMMVDNLRRHDNRSPILPHVSVNERYSSVGDNVYNHLHFNQSLPNLFEGNEYAHAADSVVDRGNRNNTLNKSENCLIEVRNHKTIQNYSDPVSGY